MFKGLNSKSKCNGFDWRNKASMGPLPIMKYTHLSEDERHRIAALRTEGKSLSAVARRLGRAPWTISREVRRNRCPTDRHYRAYHALRMARERRSWARRGNRFGARVWRPVVRLLKLDWSPQVLMMPTSIARSRLAAQRSIR
jgi:IS30 family transposase